ncbi:MAG: 4Fe-4S binding protein [Deltaproteobacteria bacterium]|jgi:adenylylsulfate reductase subunit B|nr:4Fe-4S binding protein [Deltaproteobacteria bacterium]
MSIVIDDSLCVGCGACCTICPGSLLRLSKTETGTACAQIRYPDECWSCASCVKKCPRQAISLYLAPESGGRGSRMQARQEGALLHWVVHRPGRKAKTITVDRNNPNNY